MTNVTEIHHKEERKTKAFPSVIFFHMPSDNVMGIEGASLKSVMMIHTH